MFQNQQTLGVILALAFMISCIGLVIYFTKSLIAQDKILFLLIFLVALLSTVWAVDKVIAFRIALLSDDEKKTILQIIENVVALTLGYYMGSKKNDDKHD